MRAHSLVISLLFAFVLHSCYADDKTIEVVGTVDCADCKQSDIKARAKVFSGLYVTIDCKLKNGEVKTRGKSQVDEDGNFKISLPPWILQEGKLNEQCYAQLQSSSPSCPTSDKANLEVSKSKSDEKYTLKPKENLKYSTLFCSSDFFLPGFPDWKKKFCWFFYFLPMCYSPPAIVPLPPRAPSPAPLPAPTPAPTPAPMPAPSPPSQSNYSKN